MFLDFPGPKRIWMDLDGFGFIPNWRLATLGSNVFSETEGNGLQCCNALPFRAKTQSRKMKSFDLPAANTQATGRMKQQVGGWMHPWCLCTLGALDTWPQGPALQV